MKIMKLFSMICLGIAASGLVDTMAQEADPLGNMLIVRTGPKLSRRGVIYLISDNGQTIKYKDNINAVEELTATHSEMTPYYILEPVAFREAFDLYQNRDYKNALKGFQAVADKYKSTKGISYSYSDYAEYFALECQRRLLNLAAFKVLDVAPLKDSLPMPGVRANLDIMTVWKMASLGQWKDVIAADRKLAKSRKDNLTSGQLAQLAYLVGLAYDNLDKVMPAIDSYSKAMFIDGANSMELTKSSIEKAMALYEKDPATKAFFDSNPDPKNIKSNKIPNPVKEGAALMKMWTDVFYISNEVPATYAKYLPFYVAPPAPKAAAPTEKAETSPSAEKAPADKPATK